jgi:hypothetical protein
MDGFLARSSPGISLPVTLVVAASLAGRPHGPIYGYSVAESKRAVPTPTVPP